MDVNVPISGVNPGWGPTIHALSAATVATGSAVRLESPAAIPTLAFRKLRRLGHTFDWEHEIFLRRRCNLAGEIILR